MKNLGPFKRFKIPTEIKIDLRSLKIGINSLRDHIIKIDKSGEIDYVISKTCDHAGGKLIVKKQSAICPLHGWELNLDNLNYNNSHVKKKTIPYTIKNGSLTIESNTNYLINPIKTSSDISEPSFQWLNHACVHFNYNHVSLITDPWLYGPAFLGGWWLKEPSRKSSIEKLRNSNYIFISHNHSDHLHPETLKLISSEKTLLVPKFSSRATTKYLRSLGFKNIVELEFNHLYELENDFIVSILKSGDFRDDSGLYLRLGSKEFLLTVDANYLNSGILPQNIDVLMTSFASGASGFPIIYKNFNDSEKEKILVRNRNADKGAVVDYMSRTKPKYFHPYAGMFEEKAPRDIDIKIINQKNKAEDFKSICKMQKINFLLPDNSNIYQFRKDEIKITKDTSDLLLKENVETYLNSFKNNNLIDLTKVQRYMASSGFFEEQILNIVPSDSNFLPENKFIFCDFNKQLFRIEPLENLKEQFDGIRTMTIWIRSEILMMVVNNLMPWEDFSIGFQAKIIRNPNTYESEFWYHFTNVYINDKYFKFNQYCGACKLIEQNPELI
ncbi:MBL fold metallo-hydrolase [Schleiferiaceae bacterium]|nr:MBL fold metallo-hydrolase [Schleiferiaceae bacterium]